MTDRERLIAISRVVRGAAGKLMSDAMERYHRGELSQADVQKLHDEIYRPAIAATSGAVLRLSNALAEELAPELDQISSAGKQLENALGQVNRLEDAVLVGAWVLSTAAALAGFAAAPSPSSGASLAKALAALAKTLG